MNSSGLEKYPRLKNLFQDSIKADVEKGCARTLEQEELEATDWNDSCKHHITQKPTQTKLEKEGRRV